MADTTTPGPVAEPRATRGSDPRESGQEHEERTGPELIKAAADPKEKLSDGEQSSALEWFLSDDPAEDIEQTRVLELNVGARDGGEKWIEWTIRAVDLDTIRRIRRQTLGNRAARQGGVDEVQANLKIVLAGTVDPDLTAAAHAKQVAEPTRLLQHRFRHKPGLLGQIAGEIMALSGFDDEDVREVAAARN